MPGSPSRIPSGAGEHLRKLFSRSGMGNSFLKYLMPQDNNTPLPTNGVPSPSIDGSNINPITPSAPPSAGGSMFSPAGQSPMLEMSGTMGGEVGTALDPSAMPPPINTAPSMPPSQGGSMWQEGGAFSPSPMPMDGSINPSPMPMDGSSGGMTPPAAGPAGGHGVTIANNPVMNQLRKPLNGM